MITEDEITKIFCMADDFCKIYDKFIRTNGLGPKRDRRKREYHRASKMSDSEVLIAGLSAYCFFPKKPMIALDRCNTIDDYNQLTLF